MFPKGLDGKLLLLPLLTKTGFYFLLWIENILDPSMDGISSKYIHLCQCMWHASSTFSFLNPFSTLFIGVIIFFLMKGPFPQVLVLYVNNLVIMTKWVGITGDIKAC